MVTMMPYSARRTRGSHDLSPSTSQSRRHECTHIQGPAAGSRRREVHLGREPSGYLYGKSSGISISRAILQVRSRERQRLPHIVRLQFGVVAEKIVPLRIQCHSLDHPAYGEPHAANARLPVHLIRVPRDAVKALHRFYSDTFATRRRARARR